jgi:hypothetical protein
VGINLTDWTGNIVSAVSWFGYIRVAKVRNALFSQLTYRRFG